MAKPKQSLAPVPHGKVAVPTGVLITRGLEKFEAQVGGRQALIAGLLFAPRSADLDFLLGHIADPSNEEVSLAVLCEDAGVRAGDLLSAYREGRLAHAQVLSTMKIADRLPAVAEDTMRLAAPYEDACSNCRGLGQVVPSPTEAEPNPSPVDCPQCQGGGRLRYEGDLEHKKLALDLGKLLPKAGGISQNVNVLNAPGGMGGSLEQLQAATDQILYGEGEVVVNGEGLTPEEPAPAPHEEADWRGEQP